MDFLILDFGSQYTWLLVRRFRELGFEAEAARFDLPLKEIQAKKPKGVVLSGGPASVSDKNAPVRSVKELSGIAPILAVCYGMQLVAREFGGRIAPSHTRAYGKACIVCLKPFGFSAPKQTVWMSHGDSIVKAPPAARVLARDLQGVLAAFSVKNILALQFHPEVSHTEKGMQILHHFAVKICGARKKARRSEKLAQSLTEKIQKTVPPGEKVFCALSGGVDSSVTALLLTKALGRERVQCLFADTGLLRKNEFKEVVSLYKKLKLNVKALRAEKLFLSRLKSVSDPERKRKIIGKTFIDVFKKEMKGAKWLAQGTLYPDVVESLSLKGAGVTIKSHHNVGGLPKALGLKLIEPLRDLFKDEVRKLGRALRLPSDCLNRHPFPGPGLAVRILGPVTKRDADILRGADAIFIEELKKRRLYNKVWQAFAVLIPVRTVGVQGDRRSFCKLIALRAVTSKDGMTADWPGFSKKFLQETALRIVNEVPEVNRVVYDVTTKPPASIEWE